MKPKRWMTVFISSLFVLILFSSHSTADSHQLPVSKSKETKGSHTEPPPKRFGEVTVIVRQIFDPPENSVFRTLNDLKIQTQEEIIRQELLFNSGDSYREFLVSESERVLRTLRYLRDVKLTTKDRGDLVDVEVSVQDTWTVIPQMSFSSGDGRTRRSFGISEGNLLGLGKRAELLFKQDESASDTLQLAYDDRRIWGSRLQGQFAVAIGNLGNEFFYEFGDPFRSLVQKDAWNNTVTVADTIERLYRNGDERFVYRKDTERFSGIYSIAVGDPEKAIERYTFGGHYSAERFSEASAGDFEDIEVDPADLPPGDGTLADDRKFVGPSFGYEYIEQDYIERRYIDRFSRVEDFNLGRHFRGSITWAPAFLGSHQDTLLWSGAIGDGYHFDGEDFFRWELGNQTRLHSKGFDNTVSTIEGQYFYPIGPKYFGDQFIGNHTLAARIRLDYADDFDEDREFLIGADNFLRGYDARTFSGDKRFGVNFEDRVHFVENLFDLLSIGMTFFAEAGGATSRPLGNLFEDEIYGDVGLGLRIAFPKSTGERVFRIDLAFPLRSGDDGSDSFELRVIFSGGQLYSARLPTERADSSRVGVDLGF